jgi:hypothetical protein
VSQGVFRAPDQESFPTIAGLKIRNLIWFVTGLVADESFGVNEYFFGNVVVMATKKFPLAIYIFRRPFDSR